MDPFSDPFYLEYVRSQQEGYASAQRKARASISSLSSAEIAFVQSRTAVLVTSFRQRYEAARTFDLDDDMLFCPNLLTDSDWHEFWGKRFYAHNNIPRFQELNPLQIYPRSEFTEVFLPSSTNCA